MRAIPALLLTMLMLIATAATAPAAELSKDQVERLREAQGLLGEQQYDRAAEALEQLLEDRPDLAEAWRLLGHARFGKGDQEAAREAFIDAIAHGRITPAVLNRLVRIDRQRGDTLNTITALRGLMLLEPGQLPWRRLYAQQLARLGDAGRARVVYEQLIEQDPTDADAHLALGNLLIERGESERAAAALATAWHLGRDDAGLARTLGDLHAQRDQPGAAVPWYDRALAATEGEPDAELLLRRARLLWRTGRVEEARQAVQALVGDGNGEAEEQTAAEAHRLLGRIALETDRPEAAAEHWRRAVEAGLGDPQLLGFLGSHHFNAGRYEEAADWLSRRLEAGRASRELMRYLVVALLRDGQPDRAGRRLRDYLARYPLDEKAQQLIRRWRRVRAEAEPSNAESAASSSNVEQ